MINKLITAIVAVLLLTLLALVLFGGKADAKQKYDTKWSKSTYALQGKMIKLGFSKKLSTYIINTCKDKTKDARRCVTTAAMIAKAESNAGQAAYKTNVWGINEGKTYATQEANFDRWLKSYNKYWYKSPLPIHYYPPKGKTAKTGYCTDEHSSKSKVGCPHGLRISKIAYDTLNK